MKISQIAHKIAKLNLKFYPITMLKNNQSGQISPNVGILVVKAQWAEQALPEFKVRGSNPGIGKREDHGPTRLKETTNKSCKNVLLNDPNEIF